MGHKSAPPGPPDPQPATFATHANKSPLLPNLPGQIQTLLKEAPEIPEEFYGNVAASDRTPTSFMLAKAQPLAQTPSGAMVREPRRMKLTYFRREEKKRRQYLEAILRSAQGAASWTC